MRGGEAAEQNYKKFNTHYIQLKKTYRYFFGVLIALLLFRELFFGVLMGDFSALLEASIYILLLYFLISNHEQTKIALLSWAGIYLIIMTGIKAGAKSLVIMGGNGWEINTTRYRLDLFLVALGIFILLFRKYLFQEKAA